MPRTVGQSDIGRSGRVGRYPSSRRPSCFYQQKRLRTPFHDSKRHFAPAPCGILRPAILGVSPVSYVLFLPRQRTLGVLALLLFALCPAGSDGTTACSSIIGARAATGFLEGCE